MDLFGQLFPQIIIIHNIQQPNAMRMLLMQLLEGWIHIYFYIKKILDLVAFLLVFFGTQG